MLGGAIKTLGVLAIYFAAFCLNRASTQIFRGKECPKLALFAAGAAHSSSLK
jgi:hypothetical protein